MKNIRILFFSIALLLSCAVNAQKTFPLPEVPKILTTPEERANYLALHYWDRYDFNDTSLIGDEDISEQGFSNFISIMPYVTKKEEAFGQLAANLEKNARMLRYFAGLGEKYLSAPQSPVYDENLYILMLEKIIALPNIQEKDRSNYTFDLKMAKKNRIGTTATDFEFLMRNGKHSRLSNVESDYLLLFFGDPECDVCNDTKKELLASPIVNKQLSNGKLKILYVCVEGETKAWKNSPTQGKGWIDACDKKGLIYDKQLYDLPGLPVLYLLDKEHRIMMKDVHHQQIFRFLSSL